MIRSTYARWICCATVLSAAIGVGSIALAKSIPLGGDAYFYHYSADVLADGHGWINPLYFREQNIVVQAADHPPAFIVYLLVWTLLGLSSIGAHQVATLLITVACVPLFAALGRRLGGDRVGIVAAMIGAVHPAMWGWSQMIMSEPLAVMAVLALLLVSLEWHDRSKTGRSVRFITPLFGLLIGLAALARAELLLLGVVLAFLCFASKNWRRFLESLFIAGAMAALTISPWVAYNLSRFDETVLLSNGAQITFAATNCDETYGGQFQAYWQMDCSERATARARERLPGADQSAIMNDVGRQTLDYVKAHKATAVKTVFLRLGRVLGLYRPLQQINFDHFPEGRTIFVARTAWASYYLLLPFVIAGGYLLRGNKRLLMIMLAPIAVALFTCATTFGNTRYRMSAEPTMTVFAAFSLVASFAALRRWWLADRIASQS